jgi:hypothetical protein
MRGATQRTRTRWPQEGMQARAVEQRSGEATCGQTRRAMGTTQSAAAAQMRCGEFVSASVAGSVQLERRG